MDHLISGVAKFQREIYPKNKEIFQRLATSQNPEVLFITCSDSRIDPNMVTQTGPGELFICRNAGNVVPPHSEHTGGMTASIEFAVAALGISHIVICGHTDCGAMKGALDTDALTELPHVKKWLGYCREATEVVKRKHGSLGSEHLDEVTKENVLLQMRHLEGHPCITDRLARKEVQIHGWVYNIETGEVLCHDPKSESFKSMQECYANKTQFKTAIGLL